MTDFFQDGPELKNQYEDDLLLRSYLKRKMPADILARIEPGLKALGERTVKEVWPLGQVAEREIPVHVPYDAWGRRIDEIQVSHAWKELARIAVEEKLVATAYERREGSFSRIHQMLRIYLYGPSSAIYTCPLAMSDGAARAIELYGNSDKQKKAFQKLLSTDVNNFWTSGQWMTEKNGGSDVGQTSTIARLENGKYKLSGTKWFTSATTSEMAMTLARIEGAPEGSKGLSLFFLELRDEKKKLNQIFIHRLKDKMGTKALPTAELTLNGTEAELVGGEGSGVRKISSLFNITRVWNACSALSYMRRGMALAKDYSEKRYAFGKFLKEQSLHVETLAAMQVEIDAGFLLVMRVSELLGREETKEASNEESALLRILTPLTKLYTGKQSIQVTSEVIESFGGAGYIEDTGLPRLLRDCQVLSIWEGTTNVLSLDTLRAMQKENALPPFIKDTARILSSLKNKDCVELAKKVSLAVEAIHEQAQRTLSEEQLQAGAREFSFSLARTYMAALLLEHADWSLTNEKTSRYLYSAKRWCEKNLVHFLKEDTLHLQESREIVF